MPSRYFIGQSVKSNLVKASSARTFQDVVKNYLDRVQTLLWTQADYLALPTGTKEGREQRLNAKDTTYLVACTYEQDECSRERSNAVSANCCNLLFLDIDTTENGTKAPALPYVNNPELLLRSMRPFNFAAYTTASSTKEKPRMRIVVDAEGITLDDYPTAVRAIAARIGLAHPTKESLTPNQPMICPSLFADQDPSIEHPMVISFTKGVAFTTKDLPKSSDDLPEAESKTTKKTYAEDDGLEYLRAPVDGIEFEDIEKALHTLSPDALYPEWLEICCALRHQFSGTDDEDRAYELFDGWSSQGDKYIDGHDTRAKWDSIKPSPRGRVPVTIRTLLKRAHDAGWDSGKLKQDCFNTISAWIDDARTRHDLVDVTLRKIAGMPLVTHVDEGTLLTAICKAVRDRFGDSVKIADLKNDLKAIRKVKVKSGEEKAEKEPAWTKGWYYVASREMYFRPASHQWRTEKALNSEFARMLLVTAEQLEAANKEVTDAGLYNPPFLPSAYLLNKVQCPVVDDTEYDPSAPNDIYIEDSNGLKLVNTYRRSYHKPNLTAAQKAGDIFTAHIKNLIREPEYQRVFLDYIAYMVQNPGKKIRWALLTQGAEGCGKSFLAQALGTVLGDENVMHISNEAVRSGWNEWSVGYQVVIVGEVRVAGHNRHDIMNKLKELVTDDYVSVNRKHADTRKCRNVSNYIMFTNHHDALAVMSGSRRYFVIKSPLQTEEDVLRLGRDYFDNLFGMLQKYPGGLRAFFEQWEISPEFEPNGRAPKTIYLDEMIEDSADELTSAITRLIKEGESPLISADLIWQPHLAAALALDGHNESAQRLGKVLRENGYVKVEGRPVVDGGKGYLWQRQSWFKGRKPLDVIEVARRRLAGEKEDNNEQEDFC